jgi:hypothetical protein
MQCPGCGKKLDPRRHNDLVCDGEVFCDQCRLYDRRLLEPLALEDIALWNQRLCEAFGWKAPALIMGGAPPPPGALDFLQAGKKVLMAETYHHQKVIVLYPAGLRLATLCHELAHLMSGQGHTAAWARTFAQLVAWVKEQLPPDYYTTGMHFRLLKPPED